MKETLFKTGNFNNGRAAGIWGLCWYPFRPGASILETGGAADLTGKYDYIVCVEPDNPDAELFNKFAELLAPGGKLLVAAWNRYALRRWCRAGFSASERSGAELQRELELAGFLSRKWYYPLPDHRLAKAVYSENRLPGRFYENILGAYNLNDADAILREDLLLGGVIEGGAFPFMSNSFIIEAARERGAEMCPVDFAAVTAYRAPERAFVTAVRSDGAAEKTALYPEGVESLRKMAANHAMLVSRGLEAVPVKLEGRRVVMPAIAHGTLWEHMQSRAADRRYNREEFIKIFDKLRDAIIKSSGLLPPGSWGWDEKFGPVQETAYPELVPANCFYDKERDTLIFFDQEHALGNCPYSVPLSRALLSFRYSPVLAAHAEVSALLPELIERYGLKGCWDELLKIEEKFIEGVFNREAERAMDIASAASRAATERNRRAHEELAAASRVLRKYKSVGIYGFGRRGRRLAAALELLGAPAAFTADKKTGGMPPDARAGVIVVTPLEDAAEIAGGLRGNTDIPVVTLNEILEKPEF